MPRNTNTGKVAEQFLTPSLERGGYSFQYQKRIDNGNLNKKHLYLDYYLKINSIRIGVEIKWQQTSGTTEQKIPYAIIQLLNLIKNDIIDKAYIVLGGLDFDDPVGKGGWTLRQYYFSGELNNFINYKDKINIVSPEQFTSLANDRGL